MNVKTDCRICGVNGGCSCSASFVRYFGALQRADDRVSSGQLASRALVQVAGRGMIDKLGFRLDRGPDEAELRARVREAGLAAKLVRLKTEGWFAQVGDRECGYFLKAARPDAGRPAQVISRPSAFLSWTDYLESLLAIFHRDELDEARITRLDLAVDYDATFDHTMLGLRVKLKQTKVEHRQVHGRRTGAYFGAGAERILVYDKAREAGLAEPKTRIEVQWKGKALKQAPRSPLVLPELLGCISRNPPMRAVTVQDVEIADMSDAGTRDATDRLSRLRHLVQEEGLHQARQRLNEHGNFDRDYGLYLKLTPWAEQPDAVLGNSLKSFFRIETGYPAKAGPAL